ncbi:MAG: archaetidylserine decarboxylase [Polyangiaceae bacterium]
MVPVSTPLTFAAAQVLRLLPRARISRAVGKIAERRWSPSLGARVVDAYCRSYGIDLRDYAQQSGWSSFDAFFTRSLREGARTVASGDDLLVSPSDGRIDTMEEVTKDAIFQVKRRPYRVAELLGSEEEARRYEGGAGCVIYLSPRDYHRVHSPVSGVITRVRSLPGDFYPVNSIGIRHVKNLFAINRRVAFDIQATNPAFGKVALVMVAAIVVGRITATGFSEPDVPVGDHATNIPIGCGEELGVFHLGSTVVLFVEKGAFRGWLAEKGTITLGSALIQGSIP